jgi:hypothetical protein
MYIFFLFFFLLALLPIQKNMEKDCKPLAPLPFKQPYPPLSLSYIPGFFVSLNCEDGNALCFPLLHDSPQYHVFHISIFSRLPINAVQFSLPHPSFVFPLYVGSGLMFCSLALSGCRDEASAAAPARQRHRLHRGVWRRRRRALSLCRRRAGAGARRAGAAAVHPGAAGGHFNAVAVIAALQESTTRRMNINKKKRHLLFSLFLLSFFLFFENTVIYDGFFPP